jgi:hypothetical protein
MPVAKRVRLEVADNEPLCVAQIFNLPYRRIAFGCAWSFQKALAIASLRR